jgi:hypothetical protein
MKWLNSIAGYFVGEDSKKRQIGLGAGLVCSMAYMMDYISLGMYEALMPFVIIWCGAAFSAKLSKLQKAVKESK